MRKNDVAQPYAWPSYSPSHVSSSANQRWTTRTTHVSPPRDSTIHSVATAPGPSPDSAVKPAGGSQRVIVDTASIPGPKLVTTVPPSCSSTRLGTNHDEMPLPVAIARHTDSGVPGTSTSAATERRPSASFLTVMSPPLAGVRSPAARAPAAPAGATGRPPPSHRDTSPPDG